MRRSRSGAGRLRRQPPPTARRSWPTDSRRGCGDRLRLRSARIGAGPQARVPNWLRKRPRRRPRRRRRKERSRHREDQEGSRRAHPPRVRREVGRRAGRGGEGSGGKGGAGEAARDEGRGRGEGERREGVEGKRPQPRKRWRQRPQQRRPRRRRGQPPRGRRQRWPPSRKRREGKGGGGKDGG